MKQEIIYPAIYKHFKGKYYATIGISNPKRTDVIIKDRTFLVAEHTENNKALSIFISDDGELRHCKEDTKEQLVIYKSLYDGHIAYVRPLEMFASEVDKEKRPNIDQQFRFELVRY